MSKADELVKIIMDHPDLGEPMDYKEDSIRFQYYQEQVRSLTEEEIEHELKIYEEIA